MSSEDEKSRESSPTQSTAPRTSSKGSSQVSFSRRSPGPANVIEFVDSQSPNVKSAIQRHTAYHSAAQRRDARLRSLQRGSQSRYLEWGRRPVSEPPNTSSSGGTGAASFSAAPNTQNLDVPDLGVTIHGSPPSASAPISRSISPSIPLSAREEEIIQSCKPNSVPYPPAHRRRRLALTLADLSRRCITKASRTTLESVIACIRADDASTQLLIAYCFAVLAQEQQITRTGNQQRETAQQYFGRGTNILWNRLRDPSHASSDANMQAVLLLVAYTSDFGQADEVDIHVEALRTMVAQRTQAGVISNPTLRGQLESIALSHKYHLTLHWEHTCEDPRRFPNGFWQKS